MSFFSDTHRAEPGWLSRLPLRLGERAARQASEGLCAAGGALAAILAIEPRVGRVATAISTLVARPASSARWLEPYVAFLFATVCALGGAAAGLAILIGLERTGKRWLAPLGTAVVATGVGLARARWLGLAVPVGLVAMAPLLVAATVGSVPARWRDTRFAVVCLASEASCLGVGVWLPFAGSAAALLLPAMLVPATFAVYFGARSRQDAVWPVVVAAMPALYLPLAGLARNPTLVPTVVCVLLAVGLHRGLARFPSLEARTSAWARRHAIVLAVPALVLPLVLPWHFRDLPTADQAGHEGQHLGFINSIVFGKLMMADAGFTYGPAREYTLAALAWLSGGITLEHVRVAHVIVNLAGMLCLFAAMRRVCGEQTLLLLLGIVLLVTHSPLVSLVVYTATYAFGWADAARAGLATLAVVLVFTRSTDAVRARRRLIAAGALAAFATLYSHDFGLPAVIATLLGLVSEIGIGRRGDARRRSRAALRDAAAYGLGFAVIVVPFLSVYAVRGRLLVFFEGYRWTMELSNGSVPFDNQPWRTSSATFDSYGAVVAASDESANVGAHILDYVLGPGLAVLGLMHALVALIRRAFTPRAALVLALALLEMMTLRHAFLAVDPWHMANSTTPGLVLLLALAAGGRRLVARTRSRRVVSVGAIAAFVLPAFWLAHGASQPLDARLTRIASGDERPSVGNAYQYDDLPRAGDVHIGSEHLTPVGYIRSHSRPTDPVLCMTWLIGGGTEAFLSERRNPTAFDKPDEIVTARLRRRAQAELESDPPVLIVGDFFDYLDGETKWEIQQGWHVVVKDRPVIRARNGWVDAGSAPPVPLK